jgi:anti-sigma B factor antagonist
MEISKRQLGDVLELQVKGRLDNYWSDLFAGDVSAAIQAGAHHLRLDLSEVNYLSSAGIGVLVQFHKQLQAIHGSFAITQASARVRSVIQLVALDSILFTNAPVVVLPPSAGKAHTTLTTELAAFDVYELAPSATMECKLIGKPELLATQGFDAEQCVTRFLEESVLAIGVGAFGASYTDGRGRFGEFLSLGGCSAHLPTDKSDTPDYLISAKDFVPEVQVLYDAECHGPMSQLVRFEAPREGRTALSGLARQCLELSGSTSIGLAVVAEAATLVGLGLRASPENGAGASFAFPQIRNEITFTPSIEHCTAVITGICSCAPPSELQSFLRPLTADGRELGHLHSAVFSYRPIQRGYIQMVETVRNIFQSQTLRTVMHLFNDWRPLNGAGETELVRGACWFAPIAKCTREANA